MIVFPFVYWSTITIISLYLWGFSNFTLYHPWLQMNCFVGVSIAVGHLARTSRGVLAWKDILIFTGSMSQLVLCRDNFSILCSTVCILYYIFGILITDLVSLLKISSSIDILFLLLYKITPPYYIYCRLWCPSKVWYSYLILTSTNQGMNLQWTLH